MYTILNIQDIEIKVKYCFVGRYYPATRETPAEHPELRIEAFYDGDKDVTKKIYNDINGDELQLIEEQILEKI